MIWNTQRAYKSARYAARIAPSGWREDFVQAIMLAMWEAFPRRLNARICALKAQERFFRRDAPYEIIRNINVEDTDHPAAPCKIHAIEQAIDLRRVPVTAEQREAVRRKMYGEELGQYYRNRMTCLRDKIKRKLLDNKTEDC